MSRENLTKQLDATNRLIDLAIDLLGCAVDHLEAIIADIEGLSEKDRAELAGAMKMVRAQFGSTTANLFGDAVEALRNLEATKEEPS